jgi:hypothetical protein
VARDEAQAIPLRKRCHDELRLDQRELVPDTLTRPGAERQVYELRPRRDAIRREPCRIESLRILPIRRMAVHHVRQDKDKPTGGKMIAADRVRFDRLPRETPRRRVEPHGFLNNRARIGQPLESPIASGAIAERIVHFRLEVRLGIGMLR